MAYILFLLHIAASDWGGGVLTPPAPQLSAGAVLQLQVLQWAGGGGSSCFWSTVANWALRWAAVGGGRGRGTERRAIGPDS